MRVYLDNCCFNRPFDDQSNLLNHLETQAKLMVQELVRSHQIELVWSFVLDFENNDNPYAERRERIAEWKRLACVDCELCNEIAERAEALMRFGFRQKDASHIACAVYTHTDYFVTTDKKILNKQCSEIVLINPVDFLRRHIENGN